MSNKHDHPRCKQCLHVRDLLHQSEEALQRLRIFVKTDGRITKSIIGALSDRLDQQTQKIIDLTLQIKAYEIDAGWRDRERNVREYYKDGIGDTRHSFVDERLNETERDRAELLITTTHVKGLESR